MRRMRPLLGTYVEVAAVGRTASASIEAAFAQLEQAQSRWSFQDRSSELSRLNGSAGKPIWVSRQTLQLLRLAKTLTKASCGAFDISIGGQLVKLGQLPNHSQEEPAPHCEPEDIELGAGWARLSRPVRLTLDGIAKGYAVDLAIKSMIRAGASSGWINAGGDIRVFGQTDLPIWRRELDGQLVNLGMLRNAAIATSRVNRDGECTPDFPAHIVSGNAHSQPEGGIWTVMARSAWRADALTKVAANTASSHREEVIRRLGGFWVRVPAASTSLS